MRCCRKAKSVRRADQVSRFHAQRSGKLDQHVNCRIARPALNVAYVGAVDPGLEGIVFLAPALGGAQALQVSAKDLANVHARCITCMSTINLQTMSDKRLDCRFVPRMSFVTHIRQFWRHLMKYGLLLPVALVSLAEPALAQGNWYTTPTNQAEAKFADETLEGAGAKIASRCMDRTWTITTQTTNQVVCEFKLDPVSSAFARVFLGNRYSTDPRAFMRFSLIKLGSDVRVQAFTWIETETAFGQMRQEPQTAPDYFDGMVSVLLDAGGQLPDGSRRLGRYLGMDGGVESANPCCGYRIQRVASNSPAEAAGLQAGDVIIRINGKKFKTNAEFLSRYRNAPLGTTFPVRFTRNGVEQEVQIASREWPAVGSDEFRRITAEFNRKKLDENKAP